MALSRVGVGGVLDCQLCCCLRIPRLLSVPAQPAFLHGILYQIPLPLAFGKGVGWVGDRLGDRLGDKLGDTVVVGGGFAVAVLPLTELLACQSVFPTLKTSRLLPF